jgi:1-acyl-sn-glycerol-3-phosphate acyltransferase
MGYLRLLYRVPWLLLHILLGLPAIVLCHYPPLKGVRVGNRALQEVMVNWWSGMLCRIFGMRIRVNGAFRPGAQLVVANHISWLDITVMHSIGVMGFVSKAEIKEWPVIGFLASMAGTVYHQRGNHDSASGVAAVMAERLSSGGNVAIFPEGGILRGPGVKRFHGRMFAAAIDTGTPVQPLMLRYLRDGRHDHDMTFRHGENFLANFFRLLRNGRHLVEVALLEPLPSHDRKRRQLAAEAEEAVRLAFDADPGDA